MKPFPGVHTEKGPSRAGPKTAGLFRRTRDETAFSRFLTPANLIQILVCFLITGFYLVLLSTPCLERLENIALDTFFRQRPHLAVDPRIVYIEIAEDSLQGVGRWPWPRHYHAVMTHLLDEWGARAVVFDMLFSEPSTMFDDGALEEALQKSNRVYLPVILEPKEGGKTWIHSLSRFEQHVRASGHINIIPDNDGTLRRIQPFLQYGGETYPHLSIRVAFDALGRVMPSSQKLPFPLDSNGNILVNWSGKWKETFQHYSYLDLLKSFEEVHSGRKPLISPEAIRGKICLIGLTATGHLDIKANPMESAYPALGVHGNLINSILTGRYVYPASLLANSLCLIGISLLVIFFLVPFRQVTSLVGAVLVGLGWIAAAFLLFWQRGIWFYVVHPALLVLSLFLFSVVYAQLLGHRERLRLFHLATRDGLTGLFVIRHFRQVLNQGIREARRQKQPLSLVMLDIDHFKKINDTYGHPAGDMVLRETARLLQTYLRLRRSVEEIDSVARYGGEEFIVMLRNCRLSDASAKAAERIRAMIEKAPFEWKGTRISVTISLGVATLHRDEEVPDPMVHRADAALYRAKVEGRNRVCSEREH